jgi:hypothetical protein
VDGRLSRDNGYVFERHITFAHGDGSSSAGSIDCYKRGAFVLEAKRIKAGAHTQGFDDALLRARAQAEGYARALPNSEGRPPFVVVMDVRQIIELYAEFTRSGATYAPFPVSRCHRIRLADLHDEAVRQRLSKLRLKPMALDLTRIGAKVARQVAVQLAVLEGGLIARRGRRCGGGRTARRAVPHPQRRLCRGLRRACRRRRPPNPSVAACPAPQAAGQTVRRRGARYSCR